MAEIAHRFGVVAIVGRPNVGKSTLLNAILGTPLSIVTPKPQTTRHRILGVLTRSDAQLAFLDTPGLHADARRAMNRRLNRVARLAPSEADAIVHVVEARRWTDEDEAVWRLIAELPAPRLLAINKVDRVRAKQHLLPFAADVARSREYAGIHYLDARRGSGVPDLVEELVECVPAGEAGYEAQMRTDRGERFLAAERIREQVMLRLADELPYATTVEIGQFARDGGLLRIAATIWVERDGQKGIVIGAGGSQLKAIGTAARRRLQTLFGQRVFLELHVRVRSGWSDDERALAELGYGE
jgi:GTP-binding protein Era